MTVGAVSVKIQHWNDVDSELPLVKLTPRTVHLREEGVHMIFNRRTGQQWGNNQGWALCLSSMELLARMPAYWELTHLHPQQSSPRPSKKWVPEGGKVTDMPIQQLRKYGYLDEESLTADGAFSYTQKAWENFTDEDFEQFPPQGEGAALRAHVAEKCPNCSGRGWVENDDPDVPTGVGFDRMPCPSCQT